jgi:hypothetical protein
MRIEWKVIRYLGRGKEFKRNGSEADMDGAKRSQMIADKNESKSLFICVLLTKYFLIVSSSMYAALPLWLKNDF